MHVCAREGQRTTSAILNCPFSKTWNRVSHRAWGSSTWLGFWARPWCVSALSLVCHYAQLSTWVLGLRLRSPMFAQQALSWLSTLPSFKNTISIYLACECAWAHVYSVHVESRAKGQLVAASFPHPPCVPRIETGVIGLGRKTFTISPASSASFFFFFKLWKVNKKNFLCRGFIYLKAQITGLGM